MIRKSRCVIMQKLIVKPDGNFKYFLLLMRSVLNGTKALLPDGAVNWKLIYDISVAHSLAGMLYAATESLPVEHKPTEEILMYLRQMYREQLVADINLTAETERLIMLLYNKGIICMPLKGINLKHDYPQPHLRSMTDVDILCREEDRANAEKVFTEQGYVKENIGIADTGFRKDGILHFELHSFLTDDKSPAYGYFASIWERARFTDSQPPVASMSPEDSYIYLLEHLAKHIENGGAGVRMYMDIYVFRKKYGEKLNRAYVDDVLKKILLDEFEKITVSICENWFAQDVEPDISSDNALFILNSHTFGKAEMAFMYDTVKNCKNSGKIKSAIKRCRKKLFLPLKLMRLKYKAVDALPVLYPVFTAVFWFERLFIKRNVSVANLDSYFVSNSSQKARIARHFFVSIGLKRRIEEDL